MDVDNGTEELIAASLKTLDCMPFKDFKKVKDGQLTENKLAVVSL